MVLLKQRISGGVILMPAVPNSLNLGYADAHVWGETCLKLVGTNWDRLPDWKWTHFASFIFFPHVHVQRFMSHADLLLPQYPFFTLRNWHVLFGSALTLNLGASESAFGSAALVPRQRSFYLEDQPVWSSWQRQSSTYLVSPGTLRKLFSIHFPQGELGWLIFT